MKTYILTIVLIPFSLFSQESDINNDTKEVESVIHKLFNGMKNSDSVAVNSIFYSNASMRTSFVNKTTGKKIVHSGNLDDFLKAVGTPKEDIWDERISNLVIHVDDNLAQAWMNYSFYLNDTFSHCGVNSIQLIRDETGWKISDIADTRRKSNCE